MLLIHYPTRSNQKENHTLVFGVNWEELCCQ